MVLLTDMDITWQWIHLSALLSPLLSYLLTLRGRRPPPAPFLLAQPAWPSAELQVALAPSARTTLTLHCCHHHLNYI
jgi:hypothetical protein